MRHLILTVSLLLFVAPYVRADGIPGGQFMSQALDGVHNALAAAKLENIGLDDDGICLIAALVEQKGHYRFTRSFKAGRSYLLLAGGDADALDIDICVTDREGRELVIDRTRQRHTAVIFEPPRTGEYGVELRLLQASRESFCTLVVLKHGGDLLAVDNAAAATKKYLAACNEVFRIGQGQDRTVRFRCGEGRAAIFGAVLQQGARSITNMTFGGPMVGLAVGDSLSQDLDLHLNRVPGSSIAHDVSSDPIALH